MSIEEVARMPISKLTSYSPAEQRELVSRLGSAANKRLRTLEKADIKNSAVLRLEQGGGKISVRGKTGDELVKEFTRAREFLMSRFSQKREWEKVVKTMQEKAPIVKDISSKSLSTAFGYYDILREEHPELVKRKNKYEIIERIGYLLDEGKSHDEIMSDTISWLNVEAKKQEQEFESTSRRFSAGLEYDEISDRKKRKHKKRKG